MKKFVIKTLVFLFPILILVLLGLFLPVTPRASKSLLMSSINKNQLLQNTQSPRIIFVGGSNLSFGLNCQTIKDSLKVNPINTAIHASIGIKYMLDNILQFIKKDDIIVLVPEYSHYYRSLNFGSEELMRTIFDVKITNIKYLTINQIFNILPFLPRYSLTKFKIDEYRNIKENDLYSVNSFNIYGDTYTHWKKNKKDFNSYPTINDEFNYKVIRYFEEFNEKIKNKGAFLLVSFPCFQAASYENSIKQVFKVENELNKSNLKIIGSAERYKMSDSLMFNTPYHLNKLGVDYRTMMIIEDIKKSRIEYK